MLVTHSYGGSVVAGAMERIVGRVRTLVVTAPELVQLLIEAAELR